MLIKGHSIFSANVGDSRALIVRNENEFVQLTKDSKLEDNNELFRIRNSGGIVKSATSNNPTAKLIWIKEIPVLAMTRSIGDYQAHQVGVIAEPDVREYQYTKEDKMVVMASSGLFSVLSNAEVA